MNQLVETYSKNISVTNKSLEPFDSIFRQRWNKLKLQHQKISHNMKLQHNMKQFKFKQEHFHQSRKINIFCKYSSNLKSKIWTQRIDNAPLSEESRIIFWWNSWLILICWFFPPIFSFLIAFLFLLKSAGLRGPPCLTQMLCLQLECWQETAFKMLSYSRQQEKKSVFYLRLAKNKQKQKKHQPKTRLNLVWTVQQYRFLLDYF